MKRAIGLTRVSQEGDRETIHSYAIQAQRIQRDSEENGETLLYIGQERNVSGGSNLSNRPELSRAVAAVENGEADVIVAAYFDRFFRNLKVQGEVIERIERAGGEVRALDHGRLTHGTPATRLQANIVGAMSQYFRELTTEKSAAGVAEAVAAGRTPWARVLLGYQRVDGRLIVDPATRPLVQQVFVMRDEGASAVTIRAFLKEHGVSRSVRGVQILLSSRVYLGEIHFGSAVNLNAHEPIIDRELWNRVQDKRLVKGRKGKSDRLLARQQILRCGACGGRMSVTSAGKNRNYVSYRCASRNCKASLCIGADIAEKVVSDAVRAALRDAQGRASVARAAQDAARALETAQATLDAALRVFELTGAENEPAAVERIAALVQKRDDARAVLDQIGPEAALTISADVDWEALTLGERRDLIRATVEWARIVPGGRGADRVKVRLFGQESSGR